LAEGCDINFSALAREKLEYDKETDLCIDLAPHNSDIGGYFLLLLESLFATSKDSLESWSLGLDQVIFSVKVPNANQQLVCPLLVCGSA